MATKQCLFVMLVGCFCMIDAAHMVVESTALLQAVQVKNGAFVLEPTSVEIEFRIDRSAQMNYEVWQQINDAVNGLRQALIDKDMDAAGVALDVLEKHEARGALSVSFAADQQPVAASNAETNSETDALVHQKEMAGAVVNTFALADRVVCICCMVKKVDLAPELWSELLQYVLDEVQKSEDERDAVPVRETFDVLLQVL